MVGRSGVVLDEAGRFSFRDEVLDLVDRLWCAYQEAQGGSASHLERLLGLAYIVAALRQDVEGVWAELEGSPELRGVAVRELVDRELGEFDAESLASLRQEMRRRGWLE